MSHAIILEDVVGGGIIEGISLEGMEKVSSADLLNWHRVKELMMQFPSGRRNHSYIVKHPNNPIGVWGGNFSISTSLYRRCGGHDESYEGWGGEDNDTVSRCLRLGGRIKWLHRSIGCHLDHELKKYSHRQLGSHRYINK
jgi:hypothetical protein